MDAKAEVPVPVIETKGMDVYIPGLEYPDPPVRLFNDNKTPFTNPVVPYPTLVGAVTIPIALPLEIALITSSPVLKL